MRVRLLGALAAVSAIGLLVPAVALPADRAQTIARALQSDPVYVAPRVTRHLGVRDQGRVRLAILRSALGRVKVVVVAPGQPGEAERLARAIDRVVDIPGALVVVAGPSLYVITSHPQSDAAKAALSRAIDRHSDEGLATTLVRGIEGIGRADPGPAADIAPPVPPARPPGALPDPATGPDVGEVPDAQDFLDDIGDAFRLGVLVVAAAIALPFILAASYFVVRVRRRRAHEEEVLEAGEGAARERLVALGEGIRSLDLDTSMPGANRQGLLEYEQALALYDKANALLAGDPSAHRVEQAGATIAAGERHIEAARRQLEDTGSGSG